MTYLKKYAPIIMAILISFSLAACSNGGGGGGVDGSNSGNIAVTITGRVLDSSNEPVADATVIILSGPVITTTDQQGYFSAEVEQGQHELKVAINGTVVCRTSFETEMAGIYELEDLRPNSWYSDKDGDGFGAADDYVIDDSLPLGFVENDNDCNDSDAAVNPGVDEVKNNGVDDDCNPATLDVDSNPLTTYFLDSDGDGYGNANVPTLAEAQPVGYVTDNTDCDDSNELVNPSVDEVKNNGVDDDCNPATLDVDPIPLTNYFLDGDGDGYGSANVSTLAEAQPAGYVTDNTDCDDNNELVNPGVDEVKNNGVDDDCNPATLDVDDSGGFFPVPDTGQYGEFSINPMSFTDYGDTVTDNVTGLVWQKTDDNTRRKWEDAVVYCEDLDLGGHADWRLPKKRELMSIVNYGLSGPSIDQRYFPETRSSAYWTSTTYSNSIYYAWSVHFQLGEINSLRPKYNLEHVRCVRGTSLPLQYFFDNGDGTVTDNTTGLMWQQKDDDVTRTWTEALHYCNTLSLSEHNDWRLPNVKELGSLVDTRIYLPAIDKIYFPETNVAYWSSTSLLHKLGWAWYVSFNAGWVVGSDPGAPNKYVRCVR